MVLSLESYADLPRRLRADVIDFVEQQAELLGRRPLSDQPWLDLTNGRRHGASSIVATMQSELVGYSQISLGNGEWSMELVTLGEHADEVLPALVRRSIDLVADRGGGRLKWWMTEPDGLAVSVATANGMSAHRVLHEMRVKLPLPTSSVVVAPTRPFVVGRDEAAWLGVNNAAFADHGEQGGWDLDSLRQREQERWFDPNGFLLHERDGRLAAFCWTKLHLDEDPVAGEIYVIAVHPDFHGLGLGRSLTVAGLEHITSTGVGSAMLFVDHDNVAAFELYQRLGFTIRRTKRADVIDIAPSPNASGASRS